jgi:UDP-galactopyranose mutase
MTLPAVLCFSHSRWSAQPARPNHLMRRCARHHRVFFIEEPVIDATYSEITKLEPNLWRVVPHLAEGYSEEELHALWRGQLALLRAEHRIDRPILWYYTPAAVPASMGIARSATIYDCTHNLTDQHETAIPGLLAWERELLRQTDLVLVGTRSHYDAKASLHPNVHEVPSGVDLEFYARARTPGAIPSDQAGVPGPRIGFAGRLDERIDFALIEELAERCPKLHFVFVGAVASEVEGRLPRGENLHYLGAKGHDELPSYLADWEVALLPFGAGDGGRAASVRQALPYLAAGKPVVATCLGEDGECYAQLGLLRLADDSASCARQLEAAIAEGDPCGPVQRDTFLAQASWEGTWARVHRLMLEAVVSHQDRPSLELTRPSQQPRPH